MDGSAGGGPSSPRVSRLQRAMEQRIGNPLLRWILRSRLHWLLSEWLLLVSYVGRRSGRSYTFPVAYLPLDDAAVAVTPEGETNWWRNFENPRGCRVWLRGTEHAATGHLVTGDERGSLLGAYLERHRLIGRMLGVEVGPEGTSGGVARANPELAVVRFTVEGPASGSAS